MTDKPPDPNAAKYATAGRSLAGLSKRLAPHLRITEVEFLKPQAQLDNEGKVTLPKLDSSYWQDWE